MAGMDLFPPGSRLYAFVESAEELAVGGRRLLVLDCVDADELDARQPPAFVIAVQPPHDIAAIPMATITVEHVVGPSSVLQAAREDDWLEIWLGTQGFDALLYVPTPIDAPVSVRIATHVVLTASKSSRLRTIFSVVGATAASPASITPFLAPLTAACDVAVFDVGQGNAIAAIDASGAPILYFDFGCGTLGHRGTYHRAAPVPFVGTPSIVLSHWDFDHWQGKCHVPAAGGARWLAPVQPVGPQAWAFAQGLASAGLLTLWDRTTFSGSVAAHGAILELCAGTSRNDSGIAVVIDPGWSGTGNVLLPGDAAYACLPSAVASAPTFALVASHHGSGTVGVPPTAAGGAGRVAYSVGSPNSYGHPVRYGSATGWTSAYDTPRGDIAMLAAVASSLGLVQPP